MKNEFKKLWVKVYTDDEYAEKVGRAIVEDFNLKPSREHPGGFETQNGWYTPRGIARRAFRHLTEDFLS